MLEMTVSVVVFRWWDEHQYEDDAQDHQTIRAFSDRAEAEAYLRRCRRRPRGNGRGFGHGWGGISDKFVIIPNPTDVPQSLWVVRVRKEHPRAGVVRSQDPVEVEGAFASREEAREFQGEVERRAGQSGDFAPLVEFGYLEAMLQLSDFDLTVFGDWLTDHGIMTLPDPQQYQSGWGHWLESLNRDQLAALYAALHRFRFYECAEVPFVFGDYREEQWDDWEKDLLPSGPPPDPDGIPF